MPGGKNPPRSYFYPFSPQKTPPRVGEIPTPPQNHGAACVSHRARQVALSAGKGGARGSDARGAWRGAEHRSVTLRKGGGAYGSKRAGGFIHKERARSAGRPRGEQVRGYPPAGLPPSSARGVSFRAWEGVTSP